MARSANSVAASYWNSVCGVCARPGSGTDRGGTVSVASPKMPCSWRLVARTRSKGQARSSVSVSSAHASTRCSQLSSTSSRCLSAKCSDSVVTAHRADWSRRPSRSATVCASSAGSLSSASSTRYTPSGNARLESAAIRSAKRVLPTPPTQVSVTKRDTLSNRLPSPISCRRPTNVVTATGRLLAGARDVAETMTGQRYADRALWRASASLVTTGWGLDSSSHP
jgi:hypothetical protein